MTKPLKIDIKELVDKLSDVERQKAARALMVAALELWPIVPAFDKPQQDKVVNAFNRGRLRP